MDQVVLGLRVMLSLAVVLGLIWVLAKKFGKTRTAGKDGPAIEVVARQSLSRNSGVAVLTVGHRRILVGFGEQQVTMLTELGPASGQAVAAPSTGLTSIPAVDAAMASMLAAANMMPPAMPPAGSAAAGSASARARAAAAAATVSTDFLSRSSMDLTSVRGATALQSVPMPLPVATQPHAALVPEFAIADIPRAAVAGPAARVKRTPVAVSSRDPLAGSVLSPTTWRRTVAAMQERTVRR